MRVNSFFTFINIFFIFCLVLGNIIQQVEAQASPTVDTVFNFEGNNQEWEALRNRAELNVDKILNRTGVPCNNQKLNACENQKKSLTDQLSYSSTLYNKTIKERDQYKQLWNQCKKGCSQCPLCPTQPPCPECPKQPTCPKCPEHPPCVCPCTQFKTKYDQLFKNYTNLFKNYTSLNQTYTKCENQRQNSGSQACNTIHLDVNNKIKQSLQQIQNLIRPQDFGKTSSTNLNQLVQTAQTKLSKANKAAQSIEVMGNFIINLTKQLKRVESSNKKRSSLLEECVGKYKNASDQLTLCQSKIEPFLVQ